MRRDVFKIRDDFFTNDQNYIASGSLFYKERKGEETSLFISLGDEVKIIWLNNDLFEYCGEQEIKEDEELENFKISLQF